MEKEENRTVKKIKHTQGLPVVNPHAAGIDVGDTLHAIAINDGDSGFEVYEYPTFTENLREAVSMLKSKGMTTAAMESTGIYWLNLYLLLEEAGIEPYLVNAKHVKNVTGRKKDDTDAIWLQKLHSCGLLQKSFQPESEIRVLRTYVRQRKNLVLLSSDCVRRMQKALELMNIKVHTVISDILGKTGLLMIQAILNGERRPEELVKLKDSRIKASDEELKKSLTGIWDEQYLFMLKQAYDSYMFHRSQIEDCEERIKDLLLTYAAQVMEGDITGLEVKKKKPKKNEFTYEISPLLGIIAGADISKVEGISEISFLEILSEIGLDMKKWKNDNHFSAWLNVAPNTKITGGKIISSKMQKKKNYAGQAFRMAANGAKSSKSPLGDYARKMKSRLGKKGGNVATAHKIARIVYAMLSQKTDYNPHMVAVDHQKWKEKKIAYLEKQLNELKKTS